MDVRGTAEVTSWVPSFGPQAQVLESESLRAAVADELHAANKCPLLRLPAEVFSNADDVTTATTLDELSRMKNPVSSARVR